MSLAARYRPTTFGEILGQGLTPIVLERMISAEEIPDGLLFTGSAGTGKTTAARIFAAALDADLHELDAGVTGSVAEIRSLTESLRFGASRRVVVLDEAHSISKEGFNALLKSLEEPTPGVTWIIVTTEPRRIPPTIKSRVIEFEFQRIPQSVIVDRLRAVAEIEKFDAEEALLSTIAERARGGMRQALSHLEKCMYAEVTTQKEFLEAEGIYDTGPLLISAIASGDSGKTEEVLRAQLRTSRTPQVIAASLIDTLRDIQVIRSGGSVEETGDALLARKTLSLSITPEAAFNALSVLWQYQTLLASSEDPASDLRLACAILERHLHVGRSLL